MRNVNSQ